MSESIAEFKRTRAELTDVEKLLADLSEERVLERGGLEYKKRKLTRILNLGVFVVRAGPRPKPLVERMYLAKDGRTMTQIVAFAESEEWASEIVEALHDFRGRAI